MRFQQLETEMSETVCRAWRCAGLGLAISHLPDLGEVLDLLGEPLPTFVWGQIIRFLEMRER